MSTHRSSDQVTSEHRAPAPAARTARMLRAASRRRLGVRVAMVGTLAGLMTSIAVPAMAAAGGGQGMAGHGAGERVAVTATAAVPQHHPAAHPGTPAKAHPKAPPKSAPEAPEAPEPAPKSSKVSAVEEGWQLDAFFDAGYGYADAEALAELWNLPTARDAKLTGGVKIKTGSKLPFPPQAAPRSAPKAAQHR